MTSTRTYKPGELTLGDLVDVAWPGAANGKNRRRGRFERYNRNGDAVVHMEAVDSAGRYLGRFGSPRPFDNAQILGFAEKDAGETSPLKPRAPKWILDALERAKSRARHETASFGFASSRVEVSGPSVPSDERGPFVLDTFVKDKVRNHTESWLIPELELVEKWARGEEVPSCDRGGMGD